MTIVYMSRCIADCGPSSVQEISTYEVSQYCRVSVEAAINCACRSRSF